jgi:hypothetical protein
MGEEDREIRESDGACIPDRLEIFIFAGLPDSRWVEVLWHEVKHAINELADIRDETSEEDSVRRSTPLEIAFLRDNPGVIQ